MCKGSIIVLISGGPISWLVFPVSWLSGASQVDGSRSGHASLIHLHIDRARYMQYPLAIPPIFPPGGHKTLGQEGKEIGGDGQVRGKGLLRVHLIYLETFGGDGEQVGTIGHRIGDRKSTRLNSSHSQISYAVFCLKKK